MILADTCVWLDHFRREDPRMTSLLGAGQVAMHPFIVAEIALGSVQDRRKNLAKLDELREVNVAELNEIRRLIESHSLYSKGLGLTDVHLIASCMMTVGVQLWTRDKPLAAVAKSIGINSNLP